MTMPIFLAIGLLFLVFGLLFFFAPSVIVRMSEIGNKMIFADYNSMAHRKVSGAILLAMSFLMFYLGIRM